MNDGALRILWIHIVADATALRQIPFRLRLDPAKMLVRADVEGCSVVAPGAVCGAFSGFYSAYVLAFFVEDVDAAWARGENVAFPVHLHSVRKAGELSHHVCSVIKHVPRTQGAVGLDRIRHPDCFFGV